MNESHALASSRKASGRSGESLFYKKRQRIYTGLLIFVVAIGLPIVSVPSLRNRLVNRVVTLKTAITGEIKPAIGQVGENREPFPREYDNPVLPATLVSKVLATGKASDVSSGNFIPTQEDLLRKPRKIKMLVTPPQGSQSEETAPTQEPPDASSGEELKYQQGIAERAAYELLLKSNPTVANMIQGRSTSLVYKSWDAANRGEDVYWVRLKFQSEEKTIVEYIWQVKLQTNQVTPLNYNARSI
jgi:hypothetical protein